MTNEKNSEQKNDQHESGAALVTVVMISILLLIACIAMLTAVSSHSRNVTDVLSESKAYYAAESGIQATVNVLRANTTVLVALPTPDNQKITYNKAIKPTTSNLDGEQNLPAHLSRWLAYNYPSTGVKDRVVIGTLNEYTPNSGVAYKVEVSDPDNTQASTTFSTVGKYADNTNPPLSIPPSGNDRTIITFTNVSNHVLNFTATPVENPLMITFNVAKLGNGATSGEQRFRIDYSMSSPREATKSIRGTAKVINNGATVKITFESTSPTTQPKYILAGSVISLCLNSTCSGAFGPINISVPATVGPLSSAPLYANITPVEPYRLRLLATGFGPNGAQKQLEAIIQRNFFNDLSSGAAVSAIGPNAGSTFYPGNSAQIVYQGNDTSSGVTIPSIGFTDPASVTALQNTNFNGTMNPPPALLGAELPDWQQSPTALNDVVSRLRTTAQNSLRYYPSGVQPTSFGNYTLGTGITFCDGNCTLQGNGGGILVVTGQLTLSGAFGFKGLIIVTGAGGVRRNGGGNGQIIGGIVVAPYNPTNLTAGFLPPQYDMNGGGNSDVVYSSLSTDFDGQTAISDFMQGVAEK